LRPGPKVPVARGARAAEAVPCVGGASAAFYPNGRIESCTLDINGDGPGQATALMMNTGEPTLCPSGAQVTFDPEGRLTQQCNDQAAQSQAPQVGSCPTAPNFQCQPDHPNMVCNPPNWSCQ
jgi:hypothetical protein